MGNFIGILTHSKQHLLADGIIKAHRRPGNGQRGDDLAFKIEDRHRQGEQSMLAFILGNGIAVMTDRSKLFFRNIAVFFDIALAFVIARPGQQDPAGMGRKYQRRTYAAPRRASDCPSWNSDPGCTLHDGYS